MDFDLQPALEQMSVRNQSRQRFQASIDLKKLVTDKEIFFSVEEDSEDEDELKVLAPEPEDEVVEKHDSDDEIEELAPDEDGHHSEMTLEQDFTPESVIATYFKEKDSQATSDLKSEALEAVVQSNFISESYEEIGQFMDSIDRLNLVKKQMIKSGYGQKVSDNSVILAHYVLFAEGGDEPFETTVLRKYPGVFDLSKPTMIPGLLAAILSMEIGEVSKFIIKSKLAYGSCGLLGQVPPNADILCFLEILQTVDVNLTKSPLFLTAAERAELPFEEILNCVGKLRKEGNELYGQKNFREAIRKYRKALNVLEDYPVLKQVDVDKLHPVLYTLYNNLAQCYLKLEEPKQAYVACKLGLKSANGNEDAKLLFRFAKACYLMDRFQRAIELCDDALAMEPYNPEIISLQSLARKKLKGVK